MKVRYWILLTAVVAVTLVPGLAWGQIITDIEMIVTEDAYGNPMLFTVEEDLQIDDEVYHDRDYTITVLSEELAGLEWVKAYMNAGDLRDGDLATFELATDATLYYVFDQRGDPADCFADWDVTTLLFDDTDDGSIWEEGSILSQSFSAGETITMCQNEGGVMYLIVAEAAGPPPPPPPPPIGISGSGHRRVVGQDLDLAVEPGDIEPTAYQWSKDGEELGSETGATLSIGSVVVDDTGDYSCLVTYEEEGGDAAYAEAEPHYYVWVTETALPLAGGLGLGLMAGACALAGVVAIRRKK